MMALDGLQDVAIHYEAEDSEQEDQADLHKAFLHREAEIAAENALYGQQQNVAAVENRNGEKVQQAQVQADHCHESQERGRTALGSFAGNARDAHGTCELMK